MIPVEYIFKPDPNRVRLFAVAGSQYLVKVEKYQHLANDPTPRCVTKSTIEVYRIPQLRDWREHPKWELANRIGYLKDIDKARREDCNALPAFVHALDPTATDDRAVFYGDTGVRQACNCLANISDFWLGEAVRRMLYQYLAKLDDPYNYPNYPRDPV